MDEARVFDAIESLRKDMQTGIAQIQLSISRVETDSRQNAIEIGRQDERLKNYIRDLDNEKDLAKGNAIENTKAHDVLYRRVNKLDMRTILISAAISAGSGGGGAWIFKLLTGH